MMMFHAIGDLAQSLTLRRQSAAAHSDVMRLTQELSSGRVADLAQHLQGSFGQLANMENQLAVNAAQRTASTEAQVQATVMQSSLEAVQTQLGSLYERALSVGDAPTNLALASLGANAEDVLGGIMSALNKGVGGRPVFAGNALDALPLTGSAQLLSAARNAIAGATDAAGIAAALDVFFDTPGGAFETDIYRGATEDMAPHRLGGGEEVGLSIRADDPKLRSVLKDAIMVALAGDENLGLPREVRQNLLRSSVTSMGGSIDAIIGLRSDLGFAEERIDQSITRNSAERASLEMTRSDLISADVFDTASALEQAQLRLETIYTLTARTQRLNLVNFL